MRYIKPDYYDEFKCVAGNCTDTCCAGWQIMIDEDSLEYYGEVPGAFGKRLRNSIDWQEGAFYQCNRRCAFLNEEDLCDIYTELGEEALCNTCTNYPRHVEEYEGLRELSLSLSCPIAARMILGQTKFPVFVESEDDTEEELAEDFEDFDLLLFTQLEDARNIIMKHLKEASGTLEEKFVLYLQFAGEMQECVEKGEYFEIDTVIRRYETGDFVRPDTLKESKERFMHRKALFEHMYGLERLREEWTAVLEVLESTLYVKGESHYNQCVEAFQAYLLGEQEICGEQDEAGRDKRLYEMQSASEKQDNMHVQEYQRQSQQQKVSFRQRDLKRKEQWENIGVQLFVFFLYTYFCGAVYDDWIYSKMALAVESVRFIRELYLARWLETGCLTEDDYVELAYRYAREIEHSDQNLNDLEEIFEQSV